MCAEYTTMRCVGDMEETVPEAGHAASIDALNFSDSEPISEVSHQKLLSLLLSIRLAST